MQCLLQLRLDFHSLPVGSGRRMECVLEFRQACCGLPTLLGCLAGAGHVDSAQQVLVHPATAGLLVKLLISGMCCPYFLRSRSIHTSHTDTMCSFPAQLK